MKRAVWLTVMLGTQVASAKPLPPDWKVTVAKGRLMATHAGTSVRIDSSSAKIEKLLGVELSADGTAIEARVQQCGSAKDPSDEPWIERQPLAAIEAAIENKLGMALHLKKKYAEAIPHFALAAQKAPSTWLYATNLLSAQAMGGKLDDADKTIATYGMKAGRPWFLWRLAVDPELKALRDRPGAKLAAAKPGTAKGDLHDKIAYSPLGFAATERYGMAFDGMPDGSTDSELVIVDLASGGLAFTTPTETLCVSDIEAETIDKACQKKFAKKNAANRKVADATLAQLGFDIVPNGAGLVPDGDFTAPDGRKLVGGTKIVSGKTTKDIDVAKLWFVGFVPKFAVLGSMDRQADPCGEGMAGTQLELTVVPTP